MKQGKDTLIMRQFVFIFGSLLISGIFLLCSCHGNTNPDASAENDHRAVNGSMTVKTDTLVTVITPFTDSLKFYFSNPLDFYTLKKSTLHMHTGHAPDFRAEYFHAANDTTAEFYTYWAIEQMNENKDYKHSVQFATWKPWATPQERSYENDNEILVGVQSIIKWDLLGNSDFVGKSEVDIEGRFGESYTQRDNCRVYWLDDELLILNMADKKVNWFKYFWLNAPIENPDSLPDNFFTWNTK